MKPNLQKTIKILSAPLVIIVLFTIIFFSKPLLTNQAVSPSDMIYIFDNYKYLVSEDYEPSNELLSDQTSQFEVWKMFAREEIRSGRLPVENPYQANGAPLIGNDQSAVFFPTNILFYILPMNFASTLGVILRLVFAGIGMYLFLRALRIRKDILILGSIAFAFAGFNIVWLNHPHTNVSIFLPWLFWLTHELTQKELVRKERVRFSVLLALMVFLQFLGGHVETSFHICFAAGLYLFYRLYTQRDRGRKVSENFKVATKQLLLYSIPILAGLIFGMIQLLPFLDYLQDSYALEARGTTENVYGLPYLAVPTWIIPNIYGNPKDDVYTAVFPTFSLSDGIDLVPSQIINFNESAQGFAGFVFIFLAPLALFVRKYRTLSVFLVGLNIFIVLVTLKIPLIFDFVTALPLFNVSANHRLLLVFGFANVILGSIVLDATITHREVIIRRVKILDKKVLFAIPLLLFIFSLMLFWQSEQYSMVVNWVMDRFQISSELVPKSRVMIDYILNALGYFLVLFSAFLAVVLLYLQGKISEKIFVVGLSIVVFLDIFFYAYGFNPTFDLNERFPVTPGIEFLQKNTTDENILFVGFTLPPNLATGYKLHDLRNYDAMQDKDFTKDFHAAYSPDGAWELIYYLPEIEMVLENNEKYGFNVKYIAVGAASQFGVDAIRTYGDKIVYEGEDFVIIEVFE